MSAPPVLPDGTYDAFVIDAEVQGGGRTALELTIVAGELKGEVVEITAVGLAGDDIALLGMPATITVTDGSPHVRIDH
jgi:hypothetical protein